MSEYIEFVEVGDTGKTKLFDVRRLGGATLGMVKWYGPWRQYTFFPAHATVWNNDCLKAIITFIKGLMQGRVMAKRCPRSVHVYTVNKDKSLMKCERCGKPYSELDVL